MSLDFDRYVETEDALFHYTKTSVAIDGILPRGRFKLSQFKKTNDPIEYKTILLDMIGYSLTDNAEVELFRTIHAINEIKFACRVMCFCSNNKPQIILENGTPVIDELGHSEGWNRSRMWAQYAEDHSGVCLVFSKLKLKEELKKRQAQGNVFKEGYVNYAPKKRLELRALDGDRLIQEGIEDYMKEYVSENYEKLFFLKPLDYRDESEYRVLALAPESKIRQINIRSIIRGVIVGDKASKKRFFSVKKLCKELQIECRKMHWERGYWPFLLDKKIKQRSKSK